MTTNYGCSTRGRPGHDEKSIDDFLVLALLDKIAAAMAKTR